MHIGIVNTSKLISDADVAWIVRACDMQARDFAKDWEITPWPVLFYSEIERLPNANEVRPIVLSDGAGFFKELGHHGYLGAAGYIYGRIFVREIFDNGGRVLGGGSINVSDVTSHEVLEMRGNPYLGDYAAGPELDEGRWYAKEACDPVQSDFYTLKARLRWGASRDVSVSNYVLPSWFSFISRPPPPPFDKLGRLSAPFSLSPGGYMVVKDDAGRKSDVLSAIPPASWLMKQKKELGARTAQLGLPSGDREGTPTDPGPARPLPR